MSDERDNRPAAATDSFPTPEFVSQHVLKLPDAELSYQSAAGWITLRKIHKPVAHVFHTAYLAKSSPGVSRPLTFVFNGGPGAASAYLHMGALGPQRVAFGTTGTLPPPPTRVVDNHQTWLKFTDLVFIDPIGTGFSRALKEEGKETKPNIDREGKSDGAHPKENTDYWDVEEDLNSLGEFIRRFLSKHHRWTSPIFIAGESYGGFRVAKMARKLQETHGVGLCGSLLISPVIEYDSIFGTDYDLTYWVELFPSLAATAFHHGRSRNTPNDATLQQVLAAAETFATNQLARWLALGDSLPAEEHAEIVETMSDLLGLEKSILERAGGRITSSVFCRELLRDQRRFLGRYDAAVTAVDPYPDRDNYDGPDPTLFSIDRLFTAAINEQLRSNLKIETDLDYRLLSFDVNQAWKDESNGRAFRKAIGAMDDLRYGMSLNEHMKVMITHGHFDLITPYFSSRRLTKLMKLSEAQQKNLTNRNFAGGHMFYSWDDSREAFQIEAERFYESAISGEHNADG
ncbi:MAG: peptidase S10 [Planctomycetaceae bacterium]|nr:peptidase S10 [Planctomycetaceae bacterium]MBT6155779.1 peptidase S10 [Planctomycetaceae bacterium]MBT6483525.1 peptidase S10 [Planctomycetaceae bacterium]MBT6493150.1 peptidase S10 [Planctomycetaceae bacterium]